MPKFGFKLGEVEKQGEWMCGPNTPIASIRLDYLMIAYSHSKSATQEQAWTAVFDCKSKP